MAIKTTKYVRNPVIVDAVQVTEENFEELAKWCQGDILWRDGSKTIERADQASIVPAEQFISVRVHSPKSIRQTRAFVGDWLLYTERGYKVYTNHAFTRDFRLHK